MRRRRGASRASCGRIGAPRRAARDASPVRGVRRRCEKTRAASCQFARGGLRTRRRAVASRPCARGSSSPSPCCSRGLAACATSAVARGWMRPVDGPVRARLLGRPAIASPPGQHRGVDLARAAGVAGAGGVRRSRELRGARARRRADRQRALRALLATYQHLGSVAVRRGPGGHGRRPDRPLRRRRGRRRTCTSARASPRPASTAIRCACSPARRADRSRRCRRRGGRRRPTLPPGARPLGPAPAPRRARAAAASRRRASCAPARRAAPGGPAAHPAPARSRGRCGSGSRSSRSGCRSAAGSWWRAGIEPRGAARAPSRARAGGGGRRAGSLSGR